MLFMQHTSKKDTYARYTTKLQKVTSKYRKM